jgi:hypothetical protein
MFGQRFFAGRFFGLRYFGKGGQAGSALPGAQYFGRRYYASLMFGVPYYGPAPAATPAAPTVLGSLAGSARRSHPARRNVQTATR